MLHQTDYTARNQNQRYALEIIRLLEEINSKLTPVTPQETIPEKKPSRRKKTEVIDNAIK